MGLWYIVSQVIQQFTSHSMIISFGWTATYLPPNGPKNQTRRIWSGKHYAAWCNSWDRDPQKWHTAVNKGLCFGGSRIGEIQLTCKPYKQALADMPAADLVREGGMCPTIEEFLDKYFYSKDKTLTPQSLITVVEFNYRPLVEVPNV